MNNLQTNIRLVVFVLVRTGLILASLILGQVLAASFTLIPQWIIRLPKVTVTVADMQTIAMHFGVIHMVLFFVSRTVFGGGVFRQVPRTVIEVYVLVLGFTLAALSLFFTTSVNFSPELLLGSALSAFFLFVFFHACLRDDPVKSRLSGFVSALIKVVGSVLIFPIKKPIAILIILFAMSPILVAVLYVSDRDFANAVTTIRVSLNSRTDYEWGLVNVFPGTSFLQPMIIKSSPADPDEAYVLERHGRIQRIRLNDSTPVKELVLDFSDRVGYVEIELGALGLALHPRFGTSSADERGYIYVYYTDYILGERQRNRLSRFDISLPTLEDRRASEFVLFDLGRNDSGFHNGGSVDFGPDGFLYTSIGEGSDPDGHQTLNRSLFGGVLRIDVDMQGGEISHPPQRQPFNGASANYYIPNDNPFVGIPDAMEEFFAVGLRNPFRIAFDPETGVIWAGDVGSTKWEEVNLIEKGGNYQFPYIEGEEPTNVERPSQIPGKEIEPRHFYIHTAYERSVIGGTVYRGDKQPALEGKYIFADNYSGHIYTMAATGEKVQTPEIIAKADQLAQRGITSLVNSTTGELFITTLGGSQVPTGKVLKLVESDVADAYAESEQGEQELAQMITTSSAQEVYMANCSRCHGITGKGDGPDAPILLELDDVTVPDLTDQAVQDSRSDQEWIDIVALGGEEFGLNYNMAPWEDILSEEEISDVVRYLRDLPNSQPAQ